jgi:demethylmenaquinone methyltransferase/2-methoxy-6-polyprenyl-1,4-benzoquinol methylase
MSIQSYYAKRAHEYERIYAKPERQDDLRVLRALVEKTFRGKHVLEIACGTGYWTEVLARSAASVTAVDINDEVLGLARAKSLNARFERADVYALPKFPKEFDAGLAAFWWSHIPKARLQPFLAQFHRAFVPGATIMFMDNLYVEGSSTPISRTDAEGNTYQTRKLEDGSTHEVLKNFPSEEELRRALDGLPCEITVRFLSYYWILMYTTKP